jgi:hypothetical protein
MIAWLYRYVFRGIGILFLIGIVTILILAITSQRERSEGTSAMPASTARP